MQVNFSCYLFWFSCRISHEASYAEEFAGLRTQLRTGKVLKWISHIAIQKVRSVFSDSDVSKGMSVNPHPHVHVGLFTAVVPHTKKK